MQSQTNPVSSQQLGPAEWEVVDERFRPGLIARVRSLAANLNVCPLGQTYIRTAADAPSRRVRSTAKSLSGLFPSSKLGVTIGFESHTLELAMVTTLEYDDGVVAYFDQPPAVTVSYQRSGRKRSYKQTPDFLVIRHGQIVLIECKPLANLNSRNQSDPGFYVLEGRRWSCPPLQAAARELGIQHEVWTEDSFSPIKLRNLRLLGDYMGDSTVAGMDRALAAMRDVLDTKARANVADLLGELRETISVDHLYSAIARGKVAFDWEAAPLADPKRCFVYRNESTLRAFASSEAANVTERDRILPAQVVIALGSGLDWDGGRWHCTKADAFNVTLVCEGRRDHTLPRAVANDLIAMGVMIAAPAERGATDDTRVHDLIAQASEKDLRTGNLRNRRIARYLGRGAPASHSRTERRYVAHFKAAEIAFGNGYVGLLPGFSRCGNRTPRLVEEVLEIVIRTVNEHYLNATNLNKKTVFNLIDDACKARALQSPSYSWFCRYIDKLPAYKTLRDRKGSRGAYGLEPRQNPASNIDGVEPERAYERAHIDHTLIDVETLFGETSEPLGRCWLTVMIDHYSRRILAHHLSYDPPSYRSVLAVMRDCVRRWGRLPESLMLDGGKEFSSVWCETTCALYRVKIVRRPVTKARFGSQIERFFGTANQNLIHVLQGNTKLRAQNLRQITPEVDPDTHAVWTLPELNGSLSTYFYEVYDQLVHRTLMVSPRQAFQKSLELHGMRPERRVVNNELFRITTSPAPAKGTAKVQRDGVKIHYQYFYSPELQLHIGKELPVRYDSLDMACAWAFVSGRWLPLKSRHHELFSHMTQREVELAATEWRKRRSDVEKLRLSEPVLVKFLKEIMHTETLLLERRRAHEERRVRQCADDGNRYLGADDDSRDDGLDYTPSQPSGEPRKPEPKPAGPAYYAAFAAADDELDTLETV